MLLYGESPKCGCYAVHAARADVFILRIRIIYGVLFYAWHQAKYVRKYISSRTYSSQLDDALCYSAQEDQDVLSDSQR